HLVIGGRDASSNSAVIRKHMAENDIVFHAEIHGSPFFLVKNARNQENGNFVDETAQATVSFSRAWKDGLSSGDAYWVFPNQVKKVKSEFVRVISEFESDLADYLKKIDLDEFIRMLPSGQSKIERIERGQSMNDIKEWFI